MQISLSTFNKLPDCKILFITEVIDEKTVQKNTNRHLNGARGYSNVGGM